MEDEIMTRRDLSRIGTAEEEAQNGLTLCTEYLGFESYDMKMSENEVEKKMTCHAEEETERVERKRRRRKTPEQNVVAPTPVREWKRQFPPPMSSLNRRGQRSFYLQPVRRDGRLELTRVMIHRPEIFHTSRENGRLRLNLVHDTRRKGCDSEDEHGRETNNKDNDGDQVVGLCMINDDSGARSSDDENDASECMYKNCYTSRNHDENEYYHHHHHHHIHPYHRYGSNNNMHLWTRSYVKTR